MTSETKNDGDEPPFVLQNCSAMSREVALANNEKQKPNRGWGLGWLGGAKNNDAKPKNNDNNKDATGGKHPKKIDKSLLPTTKGSSASSSSVAHAKDALHPPSPKSQSPRYISPGTNGSMMSEKNTSTPQSSIGKAANNNNNNNNDSGKSPDELALQKRREEVRKKTAWYEEYIRDQVVKQGGKLSSLNKDELVALGLFDKQRRLNRRIQLWGRKDSDADLLLTDDELEQLLVLADRSNQAQIDEAELEELLIKMENNDEVDMDRLYHLELLSRQRVGEILNENELEALEISEETRLDKKELLDLLQKKENNKTLDDIDELRFRELNLLERKRNGDTSMTNDELQKLEIIAMRREDVRINKKDYNKLLRLKERDEHVDEDRFNLLSLLDRRRRRVEISESEFDMLEQYFALREEEYLDRIESRMDLEKEDRHDERITNTEQILQPSPPKNERQGEGEAPADKEKQQPDKIVFEKELIDDKEGGNSETCLDEEELNDLLGRKERGEHINENRLHELEVIHRQQFGDDRTCDELIDNEKVNVMPTKSETEDDNETKSVSTVDEAGMLLSERAALEEFRDELKNQGLPLAISFTTLVEDDESNMSVVSFSNDTYVRDLVFQKENRESERKEECLEDAYKLYRRTLKKQKLPESEEMLLTMFAKILQKRNKEMHRADKEFDKLVETEVSFHDLRKQQAQSETIKKKKLMNNGQRGSELQSSEETTKSNINTDSQNERQVETEIDVDKKYTPETVENPPLNVAEKKDPEQSIVRGWGMGLLGRSKSNSRSRSNSRDGDRASQADISKDTDDETRLSKVSIETKIEQMPGNTESEGEEGVTKDEEVSDVRDGLSLRETDITEESTESVEDSTIEKTVDDGLLAEDINIDESNNNATEAKTRFGFLRFGTRGKEQAANDEETVNSEAKNSAGDSPMKERVNDDILCPDTTVSSDGSSSKENSLNTDSTAVEQDIKTTEVFTIPKNSPRDAENERQTINRDDEDRHMFQHEGEISIEFDDDVRRRGIDLSSNRNDPKANLQKDFIEIDCSQSETGDKLRRENEPHDADLLRSTQNISIENAKGTKEISRAKDLSTNDDNRYEYKPSKKKYDNEDEEFDALESKPEGCLKSIENMDDIKEKSGDILTPGIDNDLLYELELVIRLRKGMNLNDKQDYELDLLLSLRRGRTLSEEEVDDFKLLKEERGEIALNDVYLKDLYDRSSRGQPVNDDLLYEIELFHRSLKDFGGEILSGDEQIELYLFERRLNGDVLTEDHLEELDFLRDKRFRQLPTDHHSNEIEEPSNNGMSSRPPTDNPIGKIERWIDDNDSLYRQELLARQKAGKRLDKKEFQWLQILMKKAQKRELDEDDLLELEIMRNQKNEIEVDFVNTKKLLEEELQRQHKNRMKEQRRKERKEKEERREQRRKVKEEREKAKKLMRTNRSRSRDDAARLYKAQTSTSFDETNDAVNLHDAKNEIQIIGPPSLQPLRPEDDKKEASKGVFGGVFGGGAKKRRKEQQLEEAKRLQGELIKEQMKALELGNEAEELDREKVMQQQLVQETIEKKKAGSSVGSSSWGSIWDSSTAEKFEESDASSWSSAWDSSFNEDSSKHDEVNEIQENEKQNGVKNGEKVDDDLIKNPTELSKPVIKEVASLFSTSDSNAIGTSQALSASNGDSTQSTTDNGKDQIISDHPDILAGESIPHHFANMGEIGSREKRRSRSNDLQSPPRRSSLGFHLKKRKKKRTKDGDDVSLGTLQLSKASKEECLRMKRNSQNNLDKVAKSKVRPWITNDNIAIDPVDNSINSGHPDITQNGDLVNHNKNSTSEIDDSFQFNPSLVSRISEEEDEDEEEPEPTVYSDTKEDTDVGEEQVGITDAEQSSPDSLGNSFTSIGEEAYDLGLQEYENIESRLVGKVWDKQAEFDLTWEMTEADENVIVQINQRLRERQRVDEVKREKKKEKKERKKLKEVPRLFLFEGERLAKNGKKTKTRRKSQKKLNRTLTREFRKAMKEIFDSDSDPGMDYRTEMEGNRRTDKEEKKDDYNVLVSPFSPAEQSIDDDSSNPLSYSEVDTVFAEEPINDDEESVQFDGEYLKRLQARSMPVDLKRMLSGQHMVSGRDLTRKKKGNLSDVHSFASDKGHRRPRRKKTGEIVNNDIDPAEVYAQEVEKQKGKKIFTIAELRKEMEDTKRGRNFGGESDRNFGNFDDLTPPPLIHQIKAKSNKTKKKKTISLGKGVESLERQRPRLVSARSMRSLGTTTSEQGLLSGNRRAGRRMPATIEEGNRNEGGDTVLASGVNRDGFDKNKFVNENSEKIGANTILPNLKLFGVFKKTFKTKKPAQIENAEVGGLLNGAQDDDFETDESFQNHPSFEPRDPLDGSFRYQRANKRRLKKMKMKGVLSKLKMPGNNLGIRKFGGGIMMDDDD
jgi:hypothetical protein